MRWTSARESSKKDIGTYVSEAFEHEDEGLLFGMSASTFSSCLAFGESECSDISMCSRIRWADAPSTHVTSMTVGQSRALQVMLSMKDKSERKWSNESASAFWNCSRLERFPCTNGIHVLRLEPQSESRPFCFLANLPRQSSLSSLAEIAPVFFIHARISLVNTLTLTSQRGIYSVQFSAQQQVRLRYKCMLRT